MSVFVVLCVFIYMSGSSENWIDENAGEIFRRQADRRSDVVCLWPFHDKMFFVVQIIVDWRRLWNALFFPFYRTHCLQVQPICRRFHVTINKYTNYYNWYTKYIRSNACLVCLPLYFWCLVFALLERWYPIRWCYHETTSIIGEYIWLFYVRFVCCDDFFLWWMLFLFFFVR